VQVLEWVLTLPEKTLSVSDWQQLFDVEAVRRRYGVTESEVAQLKDWIISK
jgi:exonuclease V gamma subunit